MNIETAIEIKRKSRGASPLLRLKQLAQFVRIAVIGQKRIPDMDLAFLKAGAIRKDPRCGIAPTHPCPDAGWRPTEPVRTDQPAVWRLRLKTGAARRYFFSSFAKTVWVMVGRTSSRFFCETAMMGTRISFGGVLPSR